MHPRVAARIGLKLLGLIIFAWSIPYLGTFLNSALSYWLFMRPQFRLTGGVAGGTAVMMYQEWSWVVGGIAPLLQLTLGALFFFRADAIAKRIAPPVGRLCPDCGYDLKGINDGACPECGTLAPSKVRKAARESSAGGTNH